MSYRVEIRVVKTDEKFSCGEDTTLVESAEFDMSKGHNPWDIASAARHLADLAAALQNA